MKIITRATQVVAFVILSFHLSAQQTGGSEGRQLFIDVHYLQPGKASFQSVSLAHQQDLAVEKKYGVRFLKFWIDEQRGVVYCLSSAPDSEAIVKTHLEAHGLLPSQIYAVTSGTEAPSIDGRNLFLDVHELGAGKVTAKDVAGAHEKDLAVQKKYGVNLINYWVDEKAGVVMCLAEAKDPDALIKTHKEAHGLVPVRVMKVKQGQ